MAPDSSPSPCDSESSIDAEDADSVAPGQIDQAHASRRKPKAGPKPKAAAKASAKAKFAPKAKGRAGRSKRRDRKTLETNAVIACIVGFASMHHADAAAAKDSGKVKKWCSSFNPCGISFAQGGETEVLTATTVERTLQHAEQHRPVAAARLKNPCISMSDFSKAAHKALQKVFGATVADSFPPDEHVWKPITRCQIRNCWEHFMNNAIADCRKTGFRKLRSRGRDKRDIAERLRARLTTWTRRMDVVQFDRF